VIDEATRIRVIRAILGLESQAFAAKIGVTPCTMSNWEKGRSTPQRAFRKKLSELCEEHKICFLPSGCPVLQEDLMPVQETT
jgi:transcriptional regulator with XRE-family HTH domain